MQEVVAVAIEYRERDEGGPKAVMVECPACDEDLRGRPAAWHIADHDPEDFGLAPWPDDEPVQLTLDESTDEKGGVPA